MAQITGESAAGEAPQAGSDQSRRGGRGSRDRRFGVFLGAIALVGLIARVVYVVWMRNHPIGIDGIGYEGRALAVAQGHGFLNPLVQAVLHSKKPVPDATDPPGWILFLAGVMKLGLRSTLSLQLVACVLGSATIVMTGLAGRAAFGWRTGLIAAGLAAVYPNLWLYERELMAETLALFGVATCIWLAYRFLAKPGPWLACALGLAVGVLAMTRAEQILLMLAVVLPLVVLAGATLRRRVAYLALAGCACLLVITPWTAYNATRFSRPVVLSNGFGEALQEGNCDATYSGKLLGYYSVAFGTCNPSILGARGAQSARNDDQSVRNYEAGRAAIKFMRGHVSRVPIVMAARVGRTFNLFRPFQQVHLEAERSTKVWVLQSALFSYWTLLPLALFGSVVARRRKIPIFPFLAFPVIVAIAVVFTIGAVRYRAPAEIALVLLAAFAIDVVTRRWHGVVSGKRASKLEEKPSTPKLLGIT